jgi:hypothetical protein
VKATERLLIETQRLDPAPRAASRGQRWLPVYREMQYAIVLARAGEIDSARALWVRADQRVAADTATRTEFEYEAAMLQLATGNRDSALVLLRRYIARRPYARRAVASRPRWQPLRNDPRFRAIVSDSPPP